MTLLDGRDERADRTWRLVVAGAAAGGGVAVLALAGFNPYVAPLLVFAMTGAAAVALLIPGRPTAAIGVVFLLAAFERLDIPTVVGAIRLEQPAIGALLAAIIWHRRRLDLPSLRLIWPLVATAALYLGTLAVSSLLVAEEPALSLGIVAWSAVSMVGGLLAALILRGRIRQLLPWLAGTGALLALLGIVAALVYLLFGSVTFVAIDSFGAPRVFFPAYEPNLYASLLALIVPLALELFRDQPSRRNLLLLSLPLAAVGLGVTRAAYVALAIGVVMFFVLHLRLGGFTPILRRAAAVTLVGAFVGLVLPALVLSTPTPGSQVTPGDLETLEYRLERVQVGLREWQSSPIIGRGAYSYGQRHIDSEDRAEVIAVLPVLVLHDTGIVGFVALCAFFALLALMLWRASGDRLRGPPAIAVASALVVMLVTYLSTTALHFAVTWIVIGAAVAAAWPLDASASAATAGTGGPRRSPLWRLTARFTRRSRNERFHVFMRELDPAPSDRVLDVGVTDGTIRSSNFFEALYPWPERIVAVAPEPVPAFRTAFPNVAFELADGRDLPFADASFDVGFCNAVVEHVGSRHDQRRLVAEVVRTCRRAFICTPNSRFPVDPHTLLPFVHWLPRPIRHGLLRLTGNGRWASERALNPLSASGFLALFPPDVPVRLVRQRVLGMTSVLIAVTGSPRD